MHESLYVLYASVKGFTRNSIWVINLPRFLS